MFLIFFFNDTATTEIYTLSLHDALPILRLRRRAQAAHHLGDLEGALVGPVVADDDADDGLLRDRKSTRLNSSHANISYAVFCLKKKNIAQSRRQFTVYSHTP